MLVYVTLLYYNTRAKNIKSNNLLFALDIPQNVPFNMTTETGPIPANTVFSSRPHVLGPVLRPVNVEFLVSKVTLTQIFSPRDLVFPCQLLESPMTILILHSSATDDV